MPRKRPRKLTPAQELGSLTPVADGLAVSDHAGLLENQTQAAGLIMTVAEVARELGKSESTIRGWVARREIPFVPLGNTTVFRRDGLREWLQSMEFKPRGRH